MQIRSKKTSNVIFALIIAILASTIVCAIGSLVIANQVLKERIDENGVNFAVSALLLVSTVIGEFMLQKIYKKRTFIALVFAPVLLITLLTGGMLIDGAYAGISVNIIALGLGSLVYYLISLNRRTGKTKKKRRYC